MGTGKTYSTKYLLDSNNSSGVAGQVLSTTSTGIDWVNIGSIPTSGGTQFFNQSSLYNNTTPGIAGYGNISIDSTSSYYDTGINVFTGIRGLVWTGKHYITIDHSGAVARFYDNNFSLIPNQEANTIALPVAANGAVQPHGGGWDGRYVWVVGLTPVTIIAYDLDNGTTTATIVSETDISSYSTTTYGIEYAEGHLYTCQAGKVSMFKVEGKTVTHVFTSGVILGTITAQAITYDGSYLWFTQNGTDAYKVSLDCALVATITTGLPPNNIGWAWNGQNIAAINYSTGDVNIINTAETRFDTEKFLVMGGNVGIGTTSPDYDLDVERIATAINNDPTIRVRNAWSGEGNNVGFSNRAEGLYSAGADTVITRIRSRFDTSANYGEVGTTTNHDFRFIANGDEKIRISSGTGAIKFNSYNSTNQTGTPTYLLGTDASGNVVKTDTAALNFTEEIQNSLADTYYNFKAGEQINLGQMTVLENLTKFSGVSRVRVTTFRVDDGFFGKGNVGTSRIFQGVKDTSGNVISGVSNNSTSGYGYTTDTPLSLNTWHSVVTVFDGAGASNADRLKIYVDGVQRVLTFVGTISTTTPDNARDLYLGLEAESAIRYLSGDISSVDFYNRALSASEVLDISQGSPAAFADVGANETELVTAWTNNDFDTFVSSGTNITSMVSGSNGDNCYSPIVIKKGKKYRFSFTLAAAWSDMYFTISNNNGLGSPRTNIITGGVNGVNTAEFVANANYAFIGFLATSAGTKPAVSAFSLIEVGVVASYNVGKTTGTWYDNSGNDLDGTVNGAVLIQPENTAMNNLFATNGTFDQTIDPTVLIKSDAGGDPQLVFDASQANRGARIKFYDNGSVVGGFIDYLHNGDKMNFGSGSASSVTMTVADQAVGIGVTGPDAKLHVVGDTGLPATSGTTFTGTMRLQVAGGYGTVMDFGAVGPSTGTQWIQVTDASNQALHYPLLLQPNGGNVGIGTTTPGAPLHVTTNTDLGDALILEFAGTYQGGPYQTFQYNEGGSSPSENGDLIGGIRARTAYNTSSGYAGYSTAVEFRNDGNPTSTSTPGRIEFKTTAVNAVAPVERLRISNSGVSTFYGTVNVGTTATKIVLTTAGDAYMTTTGGWQLSAAIANVTYPTYGFYGDTGTGMYRAATDTLAFSTSAVERLRIASDGDVTIQTSGADDIKNFTINSSNGSSQVAGLIIQNDGANGYIHFKLGSGNAAPSTKLTIGNAANSGNVGIGVTSPFSKLQVGSNTFTGANGMYANSRVGISNHGILTGMMLASTYDDALHPEYGLVFVQGPTTSNYNVWSISPDGPLKGSGLCFNYQAQATNIHSPANTKIYFEGSTGSVGIGTTDPAQKLDTPNIVIGGSTISASYRANALFIDNNGGTSRFYSAGANTTTKGGYVFHNMSSDATINPEVLTILPGGNVGINKNNPSEKLEVQGTIKSVSTAAARLILNGDSNNTGDTGDIDGIIDMLHDGDPGSYGYRINTENYGGQTALHFQENIANAYTSRLYINKDGKVGVNTTLPTGNLTVESPGNQFHLRADTAAAGKYWNFDVTSANQLYIINNGGGQYITIKDNGFVGINDSTPTNVLDVDGDIRGTEYKLRGNVANPTDTAATIYDQQNVGLTLSAHNISFRNYDGSNMMESARFIHSSLTVAGDVIAYGSPSDVRLKENIKPIESALDKAMKLQGVTFDWKQKEDSILELKEDIGFIAQDVKEVVPELVRENEDGMLSMRHQGIAPILLEAIKELKAEIDLLKSKPCTCNKCNCNI